MSSPASRPSFTPYPYQARDVHREVHETLSRQDRIALAVTSAIGTMYAVYLLAALIAGWIVLQQGPGAFDPYPFAFLLFVTNIVQLLLMPLIIVGQNVQSRHREARADEEYKTMSKTFHDLEAVLGHLDVQDRERQHLGAMVSGLVEAQIPEPLRTSLLRHSGGAQRRP